ncbi:helix-turn-helix transcriptional regulator [Streptomyces hygroscopicus]|uniref:helix-turn-helix domain-containing protein n=1 Tax=Streptomyces hygroscopicus TaxID=1912 RepID=UPI0033E5E89D
MAGRVPLERVSLHGDRSYGEGVVGVSGAGDVAEFAEPLREFKGRTDRGYAALAARGGMSGSAPHRYCSGVGVPGDCEVITRFGKACGASGEELLEPHRALGPGRCRAQTGRLPRPGRRIRRPNRGHRRLSGPCRARCLRC